MSMHRLFGPLILFTLAAQLGWAQNAQPPLNANDWNFILVPAFEQSSDQGDNNLSVTGLNHALRFGQVLSTNLAGKLGQVQQVYAFRTPSEDLTTLESIEPYALLNNLAVKVHQFALDPDSTNTSSPLTKFIRQLLANGERGTYVMALPAALFPTVWTALTCQGQQPPGPRQYVVASSAGSGFACTAYDDDITDVSQYPAIPLPPATPCVTPTNIGPIDVPTGLEPYKRQTVFLVRHAEAHPTSNFENGNYVCQGQWRALGANARLLSVMDGQVPDMVVSNDPENLIDCGATCSYIRPTLTVAPFAIQHGLPLQLAQFQWDDPLDLAEALFNSASPYFPRSNDRARRILVGWEHSNIEAAVNELFATVYKHEADAKKLPKWSSDDYDTVWILKTDDAGKLSFETSCEGIASASLPSTCPAFW